MHENKQQTSLIQGGSRGLGLQFTRALLQRGDRTIATCRNPAEAGELQTLKTRNPHRLSIEVLDVRAEASIEAAAERVRAAVGHIDRLINVAGLLHDEVTAPEKRIDEVDPTTLHRVFEVNAFGPLLVAKHFARLFPRKSRAVLANISARVGSIADNRLGGWYSYRASKAAQNMFTKNLSIELGRRYPELVVVALHPGTVDTDLSKPFSSKVSPERLFTPERGVTQLLHVIDGLKREDSGKFFAWDGSEIPW